MSWPTHEEAESLAKNAKDNGFLLNMELIEDCWTWVWLHASGMTFAGACDTDQKPVALVCALQSLPVVAKT